MTLDVSVQRIIAASPECVAGYAMDWRQSHEWIDCVNDTELTVSGTGGDFGLGAEITREAHFLGRTFDYALRVVGYDPPTMIDMKSIAGPMNLHYTYGFEPHDEGTLATIRLRADASGFYRLSGPLMTVQIRSSLRKNLVDLGRQTTGG
jgi:hypothetical protein